MTLSDLHLAFGATLATDDIPLHYGDQPKEYSAALESAILLDRSHEGRIEIGGADRFDFINRMSTNNMALKLNEGAATVFTTSNARILERVTVYSRADHLIAIGEPGHGQFVYDYLQRHIFFKDNVVVKNIQQVTHQFALHGPNADQVIATLSTDLTGLPVLHSAECEIGGFPAFVARRKPVNGSHWIIVTPREYSPVIYRTVLEVGNSYGLIPAGSLVYNVLRIRAGLPAGRELSQEYIPLEVGLWDEISFNKGCYTGQEIIARMESRRRLAKTIVHLRLAQFIEAPQPIFNEGRQIGILTSTAISPIGDVFALGVIKTNFAQADAAVYIGENLISAFVVGRAGVQPDYLLAEEIS